MRMGMFERFSKRIFIVLALSIFAAGLISAIIFGLPTTSAQTTYNLIVNKIGAGADRGIIVSDVNGIDCGSNCSAAFNPGETVTLTPSSITGTLSVFEEWSGACNGTGNCVVTMDEAKNVTARFSESAVLEKCTIENPSTWGLRFRITGANVTVGACRSRCLAGGGNGNFSINKPLGWCVCGTDRQPVSTQPPTQGCDQTCPVPYSCGGTLCQYSTYLVAAPTAASVSVGGIVLTGNGRGVANAFVYLTDSEGNTRATVTNPFGYYHFEGVEAGQSILIKVVSKQYQFSPRLLNINDDLTEINFVSNP